MSIELMLGDCLEKLKTIDAKSVQTCVTSPPYYGLRDYGTANWIGGDAECDHKVKYGSSSSTLEGGKSTQESARFYKEVCAKCGAIRVDDQIGLEQTPDDYVNKLVQVFREVRRVLKDDGTVFLNLGDSYFGGGGAHKPEHANPGLSRSAFRGGVPHAKPCDTSGRELVNYSSRDLFSENLCDVCRRAYLIGKSHNDNRHAPTQSLLPSETNRVNKELQNDHLPTSDSFHQEVRSSTAILDSVNVQDREGGQPLSSPVSTPDEFSPRLLGECLPESSYGVCQLCGHSFVRSIRECEHNEQDCTCDTNETVSSSVFRNSGTNHNAYPYPYYTTKYQNILKPKDLIGIPWMVAFALRADGWYLRSDCIWHKPNPMPESVKDRPTKSHEYLFLLSKSKQYYYDYEAIKESNSETSIMGGRFTGDKKSEHTGNGHSGLKVADNTWDGRNKRSVWTINTKGFSGAHFAVMPEKLVEPCILAGSRPGDTVLDPFVGSGTVGAVSVRHGRDFIGIDLNDDYLKIAEKRIKDAQQQIPAVNASA